MIRGGVTYRFEKNLRGDIVRMVNEDGTKWAEYSYDAWRNITETFSNALMRITSRFNIFRYRGYVYDVETGLYYCQSRY